MGGPEASILARFAARNLDPALAELVDAVDEQTMLEGVIRLEDPDQVPPGFTVVSRFDRICTGRFPAGLTWAIRADSNTLSLKAAARLGVLDWDTPLTPNLPDRVEELRDTPPGWPFTGRDCVVAALDFGLDFTHPNFLNPDGTTRLLAFWHQAARYDRAHPNRFGYGRIYSRAEIDAAIRSPDPYSALESHPSISDTGHGSHGTLTLDIAAGNGRAPGAPVGVAPEAHLLFVHLSTPRLDVAGYLGDSVRLLEGLDFVRETAAGLPWVVNLSVGAEAGGHDGTSPVEQAMHELLRVEPNRAIAQSAGNYQSAHLAVNGWIREGEYRDLDWIIDPRDTTPNQVDIWYSGSDRFVVAVRMPHTDSFVAVRLGTAADLLCEGRVVGRLYHRKEDPNSKDHNARIYTYAGAPPGSWTIRLIGDYVISGRFHAWIERDLARPGAQSRFDSRVASPRYTLGTIATSPLVLTVGAYDPHTLGEPVAPFSSFGPTRDERRDKAELLARGVVILGARSTPRGERRQAGLLVARSGTSMASPHVAGACAVLMEAAGRPVSVGEIREALRRSAYPMTDDDPPDAAAWGRLNLAGAIQIIQNASAPPCPDHLPDAADPVAAPSILPRPLAAEPGWEGGVAESDGSDAATIVRPSIELASRVVVVKHPHTAPARRPVVLRANARLNGSGLFTVSSAHVDFYTAPSGGTRLRFDGDNVFRGAQLVDGIQLYAEGASASTAVDDVELQLALRSSTDRVAPMAVEHLTAVEVTLDICQSRTGTGVDPVPLSMTNKISIGRFLQVQDHEQHAGRAMLIVRRARPAGFRGILTLTSNDARLQVFEHETGPGAAIGLPLELENSRVPAAGLRYWVEGRTASGALRDTALQLGVKDLEPAADRVAVTVVTFSQIRAVVPPTPAR
ncbi:MAG: S8 family serine peptidase, partial [Chloroflexi bacterium]|nr:S8 family serine peptidase [Chloroflexota bacterium]